MTYKRHKATILVWVN